MAAPSVQDLTALINTYKAGNSGQQALIDKGITANDTSGAAQIAGLGVAKDNAFGEITQGANDKGMMFSGFAPDAQAKYTGATYLPALATLQSTIAGARASLLGKKAELDTNAYNSAVNTRTDQQKSLDAYNTQQDQNAFTARQADLDRAASVRAAQIASAASSSRAAAAVDPAKGYSLKQSDTGLSFTGPNGRPVTAAQYASVTGANIVDLLSASKDPGDKKIIKAIAGGASYPDLAKKYPWVFGGV